MKCEEIKELLTEYLDGELPAGDAASVEEHAAECEACRAELEALRQTSALLKSLPRADAPAGLARNVAASLDRQITARRRAAALRWMHVGGWLSAAAAIIIMINLAPWESPSDSTTAPERDPLESARVEEESPAKDAAVLPPEPEAGSRREAASKKAEFDQAAKPRPDEAAKRTAGSKLDAADDRESAPAGHDKKPEGAAAPGAPAGKGGAVESVVARAKAARGKAPSKEAADVVGRAMKKGRTSAKTKNDLAAKSEAAGPDKTSVPLTLTYACKDVKAGRADVLKALKAAQGAPRDADKEAKADTDNVVAARVPLGKLPGLVAALKLSGWSPPKTAPARKVNEAAAVRSQEPAQLDAAPQAQVRQPVQPTQRLDKAVADLAEQDLQMITIKILLKVAAE